MSSKVSRTALGSIPELQLAHSWRVDDEAATRQHHQLAVRGRVPAARIGCAHLACPLNVDADEAVDDRALADA